MPESKNDYEKNVRDLISILSSEESEKKADHPSHHHGSGRARLSSSPVATPLSDMPLVLGREPSQTTPTSQEAELSDKTNVTRTDRMVDRVDIIIPTADMLSRSTGGQRMEGDRTAVDDESFVEYYVHTQRVLRESRRAAKKSSKFFERQKIRQGDTIPKMLRKLLFWIALMVSALALCFGVYIFGIRPLVAVWQDQRFAAMYDAQEEGTVGEKESAYPQGMLAAFRDLYGVNKQVFGYIQYQDTDGSFLNINYPIVFSGDNTTYLNKGFDGEVSLDGALYVDERCGQGTSPLTIIYGKNPTNGRMFASLNTLVGSVNNARAASRFTYSTLYEKAEYRVFAVVLTDESSTGTEHFDCCRTDFASDTEFDAYMQAVMQRSIFDYGVSVSAADDVVVLVTDASHSVAKINNARVAVFARRVYENESEPLIIKNDEVIMPLAWYRAQGLTPHSYYSQAAVTQPSSSTTTVPTNSTTAPSADDTSSQSDANTTTTTRRYIYIE